MTGTPRRAKNSLSRKKFLGRLNKGLPIFTAYNGAGYKFITRDDKCRDLHLSKWSANVEFVTITRRCPSGDYIGHSALIDINVERNTYNRNFVFRTLEAAQQYLSQRI